MSFSRFSFVIAMRTSLILLSLVVLSYLILQPGYHAATITLVLVIMWQAYAFFTFVSRTNTELVRFLDAAKHADYTQRFELSDLGAGFSELGDAFTEILQGFQASRHRQEETLRHLKAVVEHVPVPLISVKNHGKITLWNHASRRLFGHTRVADIKDLQQFGEEFSHHLGTIKAGEKRLVAFQIDGISQQLNLATTDVIVGAEHEKLISLQDIKGELDAIQIKSWQDLVNVLTHEIMNSITPVSSLANTAVELVSDTKQAFGDIVSIQEYLDDIASAVETVARRSEGLMTFVGSYRQLTILAKPRKSNIVLSELFQQVICIVEQDAALNTASLISRVEPIDLKIHADKSMIEQILINLVKNAQQATQNLMNATITLQAGINRRGHVTIDVIDNGHGISNELKRKIFIPFFTTKKEGSGVGLALTQLVMNAHNGTVKVTDSEFGGAQFSLMF